MTSIEYKIKKIKNSDLDEEDKQALISFYLRKKKLSDPFMSDFDLFDNLKSIDNMFINNMTSMINMESDIKSNIKNEKGKSYVSSYSSSSSSFTGPNGKTIVHKNNMENINGKVKRNVDCYQINKNGDKEKIDCNAHNKNSSKNEYFSNLNKPSVYGKVIKITHK